MTNENDDPDVKIEGDAIFVKDEKGWIKAGGWIRCLGRAKLATNRYKVVVELADEVSHRNRLFVPPSEFANQRQLMGILLDAGYQIDQPLTKNFGKIHHHLLKASGQTNFVGTDRCGWNGDAFVTPNAIFGGDGRYVYVKPAKCEWRDPDAAGTTLEWKNSVGILALNSSRMMLAISTVFAAPVLKLMNGESGGIHFEGVSSLGKTTLLLAAMSVIRKGTREELLHWNFTPTAMDELAKFHCDGPLFLDEIAHLGTDDAKAYHMAHGISFKITQGRGRFRSHNYGQGGEVSEWRVLLLSTGERGIASLASGAGRTRIAGDEVRLIDVPAKVHDDYGIFEKVPAGYTSRRLIEEITEAASKSYGAPYLEFVRRLVEDRSQAARMLLEWRNLFFQKNCISDGYELRFAQRFADAFAAAKLAIQYEILPWTAGQAGRAISEVYRAAQKARLSARENSDPNVILRTYLLSDYARKGRIVEKLRAGHAIRMKISGGEKIFAISKPRLRSLLRGHSLRLFTRQLADHGYLIANKSGARTRQLSIGNRPRKRFYCVKRSYASAQ